MTSSETRRLPQLEGRPFLTDSGMETTLIFHEGRDLPCFAAFVLHREEEGETWLTRYFERHAAIAARHGCGFVFESATWRASPDWGRRLGIGDDELAALNRRAVRFLHGLAHAWRDRVEAVVSGCIGPRGDGYQPEGRMTAREAAAYHALQAKAFAEAEADMISAITMTTAEEALGVANAAAAVGLPAAISFTVETDGNLPDGRGLGEAIALVDERAVVQPAYYMINCAHPQHFALRLAEGGGWVERIRGLRCNASRKSHAELDVCETLDDGDPAGLGGDYVALRRLLPNLTVLGGCCGTDHRHVEQIARRAVHGDAARVALVA